MTKFLDWESLKELRCPKCYEDLTGSCKLGYVCVMSNCDFHISGDRLKELAEEMIDSEYEREQFNELINADK